MILQCAAAETKGQRVARCPVVFVSARAVLRAR
jgi:hypothetical protein